MCLAPVHLGETLKHVSPGVIDRTKTRRFKVQSVMDVELPREWIRDTVCVPICASFLFKEEASRILFHRFHRILGVQGGIFPAVLNFCLEIFRFPSYRCERAQTNHLKRTEMFEMGRFQVLNDVKSQGKTDCKFI
jgi:hypothetical protein